MCACACVFMSVRVCVKINVEKRSKQIKDIRDAVKCCVIEEEDEEGISKKEV